MGVNGTLVRAIFVLSYKRHREWEKENEKGGNVDREYYNIYFKIFSVNDNKCGWLNQLYCVCMCMFLLMTKIEHLGFLEGSWS